MNYFDDERNIIENFQNVSTRETLLITHRQESKKIFESINNKRNWKYWTFSGNKSDPPPDFYSDKYKLMMDVMRVDDHTHKVKGKLINETNAKESKIQNELKCNGLKDIFPNANFIVNAITDLPTEKDHSYLWYKESFARVLNEHNNKVELYKKNHLGYKIIFFVFDESSLYLEANEKIDNKKLGMEIKGRIHVFFEDEEFLNIIKNLDIDYLIWYAPYKYAESIYGLVELPKVVIYDLKNIDIETINYNENLMVSAEV